MGGPNSGRKPNHVRRRQAAALRAAGLTVKEVGLKLGVTKEAVRQLLLASGLPRRLPRDLRRRWQERRGSVEARSTRDSTSMQSG